MTPADASAAFMNDTGPDAVPPPASFSLAERMRDRLTPEPEPPLKMIPSLRYQPRICSMVSFTDRMKHAEHCGCGSMPTLNHTGALNDTFWVTSRGVNSGKKETAAAAGAK